MEVAQAVLAHRPAAEVGKTESATDEHGSGFRVSFQEFEIRENPWLPFANAQPCSKGNRVDFGQQNSAPLLRGLSNMGGASGPEHHTSELLDKGATPVSEFAGIFLCTQSR
jgi:hypothetical protein